MLPKNDQLISIQDAADVLGVSTKTLRRWEAAGKLVPQRTAGGHRRYLLLEVKRIKRQNKKNRFKRITAVSPAQEYNFEVIKTLNQKTTVHTPSIVTPVFAETAEEELVEVIKPSRRKPALGFAFLGLGILLLITAGGRSLIANIAENKSVEENSKEELTEVKNHVAPKVLAIQTSLENLTFTVNVPSRFNANVNINGDITTENETFNIVPENATTINIGGATGITNINNNLAVAGDIDGDSDLNIVGVSTLPTIVIGEDTLTELVGTGLSLSGTTLQTTLGTSISASELESSNTPTNGQVPTYNSSTGGFTWANQPSSGASGITGTGTANALAKFTGASTIADSGITDDGTTIGIASSIISFDDATLTSAITLTDVDTSFDSGDTAIVDAINTAYNAAIGSSAWTITAGVLHPTDTTNDLAIGGTTTTSSMFGIDESAGNFYFGYDNSASPTLNFEATDGDAGEIAFTTTDTFAFNNASISTTGNLSVAGATGITMSNTASSLTFGNGESINNTIDGRLTLVAPSVSFNSGGSLNFSGQQFIEDMDGGSTIDFARHGGWTTVNIADAGLGNRTIDIGGVTSGSADTVNISTNSTGTDTITIGNTNAATALNLSGGVTTFDDATLTNPITLTDTDVDFDSGDTAIVDAINSAYNAATGGGGGLWSLTSGTIHPTTLTQDLAIGGTSPTASVFGVDESAANFYFGYDNTASPTLNFEATDGDAGELAFSTNDAFGFTNARVGIGTTNPATYLTLISPSGVTTETGGILVDRETNDSLGRFYLGSGTDEANATREYTLNINSSILRSMYFGNEYRMGTANDSPVTFYQNNAEIMRIHTNDNVGIGVTAPAAKLEVGNGTDSLQISSVGDMTFVDADGGSTITGPAGGALAISSGASQDISLTGSDDIIFDDAQLSSSITLTDVDTDFDSGDTAIVDAINTAYNAATGGGGGVWTLAAGILHPTTTTNDVITGGTTAGTADIFLGDDGAAVFNEQGNNADLRIEGDTDTSLFISDASTDRIGIGTNSPDTKFDVNLGTASAFQLTYNDADGSATTYSRFTVSSGGDLVVAPTGGDTTFSSRVIINSGDASNAHLQIRSDGNTQIRLLSQTSSGIGTNLLATNASNGSIFDINPYPLDGTSISTTRLFRSTNTSGRASLDILAADNTATTNTSLAGNGDSYIAANTGNVGIGDATPSSKLEVGNGTDSLQISSVGDLTFVDANDGSTITGPAGGALFITSGTGQDLSLVGVDDMIFDDATLTNPITLTDTDVDFDSGDTAIVDAINTAYNAATGGGGGIWTLAAGVIYPTAATNDVVTGGTDAATADIFLGDDGAAVFNEQGNDADFRIETDTNANMFVADGGLNVIQIGNGTDLAQFASTGDITFVDANDGASITGPAGGALTIASGAAQDLALTGTDDMVFDDATLSSSITLTDTDSSFTSGDTAIVDAINTAYGAATGGGGGLWTLTSGVIHPTTGTHDLAIGGSDSTADFFVADNGQMAFNASTAGTYIDFILETEWTSGDLINADFASSTTQTGNMVGIDLDLNTNLTGASNLDVTGVFAQTPTLTATGANTTDFYGFRTTGGALDTVDSASATIINWFGNHVQIPNIDTGNAADTVNAYGLYIAGGTVTAGAGTENTYGLVVDNLAGNSGFGTTAPTQKLEVRKGSLISSSWAQAAPGAPAFTVNGTAGGSIFYTSSGADNAASGVFASGIGPSSTAYAIPTLGTFGNVGLVGSSAHLGGSVVGTGIHGYSTQSLTSTVGTNSGQAVYGLAQPEALANISAGIWYGVRGVSNISLPTTLNGTPSAYGGHFTGTAKTGGTAIGVYGTATGGDNNYAGIFEAGNVGIGDTSPSAKLEIGDGTDSLQVSSVGDLTFVDANGAASITGPAGGALAISSGTSQDITLTGSDDIVFDDAQLTAAINLTDVDTDFDSGDTAIVDAINTAYNAATGGGGGLWSITSNVIHPTDTTDDFALGGTSAGAADIFLGDDGTAVFNEQGNDVDFRIESDTNPNMFFVDAGNNVVQIGDGTDSLQVSSVGDLTFVDANGGASITGPAGGALTVTAGASQALTLTGNAASTWSTSAGDITLSPGGGEVSFTGNAIPTTDDTYNLGDDTHRWADLFLGGETIHLGASTSDEAVLSYTTSSNTLAINNAAAGVINIGTTALAQTITLGNTTGATAVNLTSGTGDINLSSTDDIVFDDAQLTAAINLTDTDTDFDSGDTAIVDAINTAYAAATGGGGGLWTLTSGVIHPTTGTNDLAIGGTDSTADFFVSDNGKLVFNPATTGTFVDFNLNSTWTTGTLMNADFSNSTTLTGDAIGLNLNLNTNVTGVADGDVTGLYAQTPALTSSGATTTNYYGSRFGGGALDTTDASATVINWYGNYIQVPDIDTGNAADTTNAYGLYIAGGTATAGAGAENEYGLIVDGNAGFSGIGTTTPTRTLSVAGDLGVTAVTTTYPLQSVIQSGGSDGVLLGYYSRTAVATEGGAVISNSATNPLYLGVNTAGTAPLMRIGSANVYIGTTANPNQGSTLTVEGDIGLGSQGAGLTADANRPTLYGGAILSGTTGDLVLQARQATGKGIVFATGESTPTTKAVISEGGNFGIGGDTSPDALLEVGDGTDEFQVDADGDVVFVDANGGASITGPAGGALTVAAGASQALTLTGNAASTWSTSAGDITLSPGGGEVSVTGNLIPTTNDTYNLGDDTHRWADIFLGGETLHIGASTSDEAVLSYTTSSNTLLLDNVAAGVINIGTTALAQTITLGNTTGTTAITFNAGSGNITFDDDTLSSPITLTGTDADFDSGDTSIVDAINTAYNAAGGSAAWTITSNVIHPTTLTDDVAIGGNSAGTADIFLGDDATTVFNEQGNSVDFRIEGDSNANLFFVDGSADAIGIGMNNPTALLSVGDGTDYLTVGAAGDLTFVDANGGSSITGPAGGALLVTAPSTALNLQSDGSIDVNLAGGSGATGCTIANTTGNLTCTGDITGGSSGTVGYWTRTGTTLTTANAGDNVTIDGTFDANGVFTIGDGGDTGAISSTTLDIDATGALQINSSGGAIGIGNDAVAQAINIGTGAAARTITTGNATSTTALAFNSGTGSQTFTSNVASGTTTTSGFVFDATAITSGTGIYATTDSIVGGKLAQFATTGNTLTTGTLLDISSTATSITTGAAIANGGANLGSLLNVSLTGNSTFSGNLGTIDWSPTSATTASGNLLTLNVGTNGTLTGDIFQVQNAGSDLFSINQSQITSAIPHQFTAAGDVTMAYDLVMTNQTTNNIQSYGPLTITSGESFENNNLTLQTYGTGKIIADGAFSLNTQETLEDSTTPNVSGASNYIETFSTNRLITNFLGGLAGQIIVIEATDADMDFDCTSNANFNCGNADITAADGDNFTWIYSGTTWNLINYMNNSTGGGNDLAELFPTAESMEAGDVVSIHSTQPVTIQKALESDGKRAIGIVSTEPGVVLGTDEGNSMPVALAGRVPVKISETSEAIYPGDLISASPTAGRAQKLTGAGWVIGRAMDTWIPGQGQDKITIFVNPIYVNESQYAEESGDTSLTDRVTSLETALALIQTELELNGDEETQDTFTDLTITNLTVLDDTVLSDTIINGTLNVGTIQISNTDNSIDAIGTLKIQPSALANIEFMGGLISFDQNGNVVVQTITADKYKVAGASAGTGVLLADEEEVFISTDQVEAGSLIFVTPKTLVDYPLVVTERQDGIGFKVQVSVTSSTDTEFDWWIVDKTE